MRKIDLERLLEKSVAEALGVALPDVTHRATPARLPRHAHPKRARYSSGMRHHHHRTAEHA